MSLFKAGVSWLRQSASWSNSTASWRERLVLSAFLASAVGLGMLSAFVQTWQAGVLWAIYLVALAICSRQGWLQLFGPVLFYDMIRTARQSRFVLMRLLYASVLLAILCGMYSILLDVDRRFHGANGEFNSREAAVFGERFFMVFMIVQISMVVVLTPAYVAGAIAEEKDRKTLEFMLATDLSNHEIVLSKLLSRLANITLFLATGLPILSILQFLGGVDTQLMLVGFAGTGLTMLGIASVSILFSTLFQKPRDAIGLTYLTIIAYGSLGTLGKWMALLYPAFMLTPIWFGESAPTLAVASDVVNTGNPIAAMIDIAMAIQRASLGADLPVLLTNYAYFYGILSLVCILWSIVRLRAIALTQSAGGTTQKRRWWDHYRPPIGELPMIWKELHIESRMKLNWLARCIIVVLVLLTVGSGVVIVGAFFWELITHQRNHRLHLSEDMNIWFRIAGTGVACLMLLVVAVRASTSITNERERDTFDALLTTPMSSEAILSAKVLGCLTSVRLGWLWFGSMIAIGIVTGGLHLFAVPIVLVSWFVYALFFTMVGMWYSMACRSSMRATVYTVLTVLFLGGGHWLVMGLCCYFPAAFSMRGGDPGRGVEYLAKFQAGMTPPFVLGICAYSWENLAHDFSRRELLELIVFSLIGIFLWGMGCLILWYGMLIPKFRAITRREEVLYE